ncbi:PREDICTED: fibulin-7 [Aptenodytes forsteri]|uniref:fibulin-7 n=1 Tax=Aptenodytes forsteri TaxID=9233 RepID=UPI0009057816|nr:PREDICTED: fibulin-7 [Aptenodytes forsteri]
MQQLLKGQETRFTEGLRVMKSRLSTLHASLAPKAAPEPPAASCPALQAPADGRKFGTKYLAEHEVHFTCDPGFQLLGSSTRTCQANGSWTGQEPRCVEISECSSSPCQNGGTCLVLYIDECALSQDNCTRGTTCINTGGGFQCVSPQCPQPAGNVTYVKTSPFQCERNPCPMESRSCHQAPKTISFHYLPRRPAAAPGRPTACASASWAAATAATSDAAGGSNRGHFVMQRSDRQTGELILVQSLKGPQTIQVDVDMSEYLDRVFQAKHVSKITVFVSAYEF